MFQGQGSTIFNIKTQDPKSRLGLKWQTFKRTKRFLGLVIIIRTRKQFQKYLVGSRWVLNINGIEIKIQNLDLGDKILATTTNLGLK